MKKKLIYTVVAFLSIINFCYGQEGVKKYFEVTVAGQRVSINFGNPHTYFKDSTVKNSLLAINNFKNAVDVLDYMSKLGWSWISTTVYGTGCNFSISKKNLINQNLQLIVIIKNYQSDYAKS